MLRKAANLVRERADKIARIMTQEQGKVLGEAKLEVLTTADIIEWYAEEGRRAYGRVVPGRVKHMRMMMVQEPVGVVAAFTPWNFPTLTPARKIGGALAGGCSLILKASEETPGSCVELVRCVIDAGLPPGVLNLVFGVPANVSEHLIPSDTVRKISFTGSIPVGKHLAGLAAKGVKRTTLELGGHSPVVVFGDADPEKTADTIAAFKYRNAGQVCIAPTRFYVQEPVYDRFLKRFTEFANGIKLGDGLEQGTTMGPMANSRRLDALESFVNDAKNRGGKIVTGGKRRGNQGYFFEPTVVTDVPDDSKVMTEEPFGPIAPIVTFKSFDEVVARANSLAIRPRRLCLHGLGADRKRHRRRAGGRHGGRQQRDDLDAGDAVRRGEGSRATATRAASRVSMPTWCENSFRRRDTRSTGSPGGAQRNPGPRYPRGKNPGLRFAPPGLQFKHKEKGNMSTVTKRVPGTEHWTKNASGQKIFMAEKRSVTQPPKGTILLVHGSSMGSQGFDLDIPGDPDASLLDWFACRGFDIWRMDFIGYGRSDKPPDHLANIAQAVPDLLAATDYIMKNRNSGPLMLLGFSSGALRAARFAQEHPDRVKRLALDAMVWTGKGSPTLKKRAEKLAEWESSVTRPIDPAFLLSTMTRDHSETAMESRKKPYIDAILAIETTVPNGTYIDMCKNLPVCDPKQIKVPTAILRGQHDGIASDEDLLEFFKLLPHPDKEFVMMPGIAHAAATSKNYARFYDAAHAFFSRPEAVFKG